MTVVVESLGDFTLENLKRVSWRGEPVVFGEQAVARIQKTRREFLDLLEREPDIHIYGVTTGYSDAAGTIVDGEERLRLAQRRAGMAGIGVGEPMGERAVRAMLFTRLINYVAGYDGLSLETAQQVAEMLDGRPLPLLRRVGVDSQGEVLQLLTLFNELEGERLQVRDGNALTNGTGCAPGLLGDVALRARRRSELLFMVLALSIDAANLGFAPYDTALKPIWGDQWDGAALDVLAGLLAGASVEGRRQHQPPISWRIVTRMIGHVLHTVEEVEEAARNALTRVNDNPVFLGPEEAPPNGRVVSTGGFHVPAAYQTMNWLTAAWADTAVVAAREVDKIHRSEVTGLPERLQREGSRFGTAGFVTVVHDLAARACAASAPALTPLYTGTLSLETDTIMPLFLAYEKEGTAAWCLDRILAALAVSASQALWIAEREPAPPLRPFLAEVRQRFSPVESKRDLGSEAENLATAFADAVEERNDAFLGQ
jgi:histidine ammonia-lyase